MVSDDYIWKYSMPSSSNLAYIFKIITFAHMALSAERQSDRMSEIKNVGQTWMAKYNQLTLLSFKGLMRN